MQDKDTDPNNYKALWDQLRRECADMAEAAAREIDQLRRQVDELAPKAQGYETVTRILRLIPQPQQGQGENMAWRLRNKAEILRSPDTPDVGTEK